MAFMPVVVFFIKIHLTVTATIRCAICRSRKNILHEYKATLIPQRCFHYINLKIKPFESENHSHCTDLIFIYCFKKQCPVL